MSVSAATIFSNNLTKHLEKVISKSGNDTDKAKSVLSFIDSVIKGNISKSEIATTKVFDLIENAIDSNFNNQELVELKNTIQKELKDRRETFINGSKQNLPEKLAKQIVPMKNTIRELETHIEKAPTSDLEKHSLADAKNFFNHGLNRVAKQVAEFEGDKLEKEELSKELIADLCSDTAKDYGKEHTTNLVASLQDDLAPVELYTLQKDSSYKLPVLDLESNADDKKMFAELSKGKLSLSPSEKNDVMQIADRILKGDKDAESDYHALAPKQKVYLEHLRQGADKLNGSMAGLEGIIGKLASKLPDMLIPAIIGTVLGSLMGMGAAGGLGAIVISALGSAGIDVPEDGDEKIKPPLLSFIDTAQAEAKEETKEEVKNNNTKTNEG